MTKKTIISFILILTVLAVNFSPLFFLEKAKADVFGDALKYCGGATFAGLVSKYINKGLEAIGLGSDMVPVKDTDFKIQECVSRLIDIAIVTARNVLKKRLLDQLVDQTVNWVQGGGEPRFISNFGETIDRAVDEGVGDTLREIGLGQLCDSRLKFELQLAVKRPQTFSRRISCTLSQAIGNVEAFRDDFSRGGFVGLTELSKPQNNRFGLKLMAMEQVLADTERRQEESKQKVAAGGGFASQEACLEWTLVEKANGAPITAGGRYNFVEKNPIVEGDKGFSPALSPGPKLDNSAGVHPDNVDVNKVAWKCTKDNITTPGDITANLARKATSFDFDSIVNSDDLSAYLAAITDAVVNRITTEGVTGLKGLFRNSESPPRGGRQSDNDKFLNYNNGYGTVKDSSNNYGNTKSGNPPLNAASIKAIKDALIDQINGVTTVLKDTGKTLQNASESNTALAKAIDHVLSQADPIPRGLLQCLAANSGFVTDPASLANELPALRDYALSKRPAIISAASSQLTAYSSQANQYTDQVRATNDQNLLSSLSSLVADLQNQVAAAEAEAQNLLSEINSLKTTATGNRTACNKMTP